MLGFLAILTKLLGILSKWLSPAVAYFEFDNSNITYGKLMHEGKNAEGNQRICEAFNKLAIACNITNPVAQNQLRDDGGNGGVWKKMKIVSGLQANGYMGRFPIVKMPEVIAYTKDLVTHLNGNIGGIAGGLFECLAYYGGTTQILLVKGSGKTAIKLHKDMNEVKTKFMQFFGEDAPELTGGGGKGGGITEQEIRDTVEQEFQKYLHRASGTQGQNEYIAWCTANNIIDIQVLRDKVDSVIFDSQEYKDLQKSQQAGFGGITGIIIMVLIIGIFVFFIFKGPKK